MSVVSVNFICPSCKKSSRLPEPTPKFGRYQLTCAHCDSKIILEFIDYKYEIVGPKPEVKPTPETIRPFLERKVVYEEAKKERPQLSFPWQEWRKKRETNLKTPKQPKLFDKKQSISFARYLFVSLSLFFLVFIVTFSYFVAGVFLTQREIPVYLEGLSKNIPTKILDRNGQVVSEIFQKRTSTLKLSDYPEDMITILLNVEDQKFFSHGGIDTSAIFRAIFKNLLNLSYKQGASTITQQLARIILDDRRKSLTRKWREAQLAFALEWTLGKEEILETYMNHVYLGHGAFGFGEGIKFYFQKNPIELTKEEMILLASLPSAPNKYSPLKNPDGSFQRVKSILNSFRNRGIYSIPSESFLSLYNQFSTRSPNETVFGSRQDIAPYVTEHVRNILSSLESDKNIYENGGYTVETTLDRSAQEQVGPLVRNALINLRKSGKIQKKKVQNKLDSISAFAERMEEIRLLNELFWVPLDTDRDTDTSPVQAAVVGIHPATGEILFLHGGEEFNAQNQFNRVTQMRRQTGSSIKAILYASAIDSGAIHAGTKILDAPLYYKGLGGKEWSPDNLGGSFDGEIGLRTALVKSKNTAAVQIAERLGVSKMESYFSKFFFPSPEEKKNRFRSDLSLALGTLELSPLEMASAFTAFVNQGNVRRPYLIKRIRNAKGVVLFEGKQADEFKLRVPEDRNAIRPDTAEVMVSLLRDSGRASGVRSSGYVGDLIGKTGTTNDYKDAWFVGARPDLSLAVWIGYDNPKFGMGAGGLGGALASPLWGSIVASLDKAKVLNSPNFPSPIHAKQIKVCSLSGKLAGTNCQGQLEYFLSEYPPESTCTDDHRSQSNEQKDLMKGLY